VRDVMEEHTGTHGGGHAGRIGPRPRVQIRRRARKPRVRIDRPLEPELEILGGHVCWARSI
jgi:hypothetical protein